VILTLIVTNCLLTLRTIARALANNPEILLLDEPTGDLDTLNTVEIMDLLLRINLNEKTTCIMVTHNPDVECYADRLLYLEDGRFARQALNAKQTPLIFEEYSGQCFNVHCTPRSMTLRNLLDYLRSRDIEE
jgi:ABC-type cobalamin/Fe3+-siderophores transport system ATPase subunit